MLLVIPDIIWEPELLNILAYFVQPVLPLVNYMPLQLVFLQLQLRVITLTHWEVVLLVLPVP